MATQTSRGKRSSKSVELPENIPGDIRERIGVLHGIKAHEAVRDEALTLAQKLEVMARYVEHLKENHEMLRLKLQSLMAHEHYAVTITSVAKNGQLVVGVAGLGNTRVQIAVHPDVDPEKLLVGAIGLVTRERNCLIDVIDTRGPWRDVGQFERYLDSHRRILLKDRETLVAVDVAHCLRETPLEKGDMVGFDRDVAGIAYERLDPPKGNHLFDEDVTDDFDQLGGLDTQIATIKRHIDLRLRHPNLATKYRLKSKYGILLHGAPGNGKTRIARCCAGYARRLFPDLPCRFMHVAGSSDYSMWLGGSEQKILERFRAIREAARDGLVFMFWDEVDAIARCRGTDHGSGAPDRILNTFLSQIDGVASLANTIILYATNRADTLDRGLLRPGRTDVRIEIPAPNRRAAAAILRGYLDRGMPLAGAGGVDELIASLLPRLFSPNGEYGVVAHVKLSDGRRIAVAGRELLSGAMLENVVNVAAQQAAEREANSGQEGLTEDDLLLALETELVGAASLLAPSNVKGYVTSIPQDSQPIAVEPVLSSLTTTYSRQGS